ncbi:hypothetical protein HO483_08740 [Streptococcus suis]|uniref:Uncharacterized protein n=1 Tax=Streptococcus parasuis TaxID=1501662 RepID=A0ABV2ENW4_9STRE|nr:hypothetical protein [Streptococcus parasuis]NQK68317.1 hypothetical protein [Streptococcus suis]NQQ32177.1 hypothetical protein [Streptococcus suis]NQQ99932.1 hypothetical protein [Streptococcus suis]WNF86066.1 hypothetical protein RJW51_08330 [Streptococcus parasuis]BCP59043.1 hypothetical protein SUT286_03690 [Streptococcus parasuis]
MNSRLVHFHRFPLQVMKDMLEWQELIMRKGVGVSQPFPYTLISTCK